MYKKHHIPFLVALFLLCCSTVLTAVAQNSRKARWRLTKTEVDDSKAQYDEDGLGSRITKSGSSYTVQIKWGENRGEPGGQKVFSFSLSPMPERAENIFIWSLRQDEPSGDKEPFWMGTPLCSDIKVLRDSQGQWLKPNSNESEYYIEFPADRDTCTVEEEVAVYGAKCFVYYYYEKDKNEVVAEKPVVEVTTNAEKEEGEGEGVLIPVVIFLGITLAVGGTAALAKKNKKNGGDSPQPPSVFQMLIYKDCGDTLSKGDAPHTVGARIEEITMQGQHLPRPDLTSMINISVPQGVVKQGDSMTGPYKAALISIPEDSPVAGDTQVTFTFNGPQGTFINHVVFHVQGKLEIVVEEGITFAAGLGKTQFMEFVLQGNTEGVTGVQAAMVSGQKYFSTKLEQEQDRPGFYKVHITEQGDVRKEPKLPGTIDEYRCVIRVHTNRNKAPLEKEFFVYRVFLGFRVGCRALKAYLVERGSSYNSERIPGKDYKGHREFASSLINFQLTLADPQTGQVFTPIPDADPVVTFDDISTVIMKDKNGNDLPRPCDVLKFKYEFGGVKDGTVWGTLHATEGYLMPPNRGTVRIKAAVTYKGQPFTSYVDVPLISQPYRADLPPTPGKSLTQDGYDRDKRDIQIHDNLEQIRENIACDKRFAELRPLYYKISCMLDGFHKDFGYYEPDYERIHDFYQKFIMGEVGSYFANQIVMGPEASDFDLALSTYAEMENSIGGIVCRIGLGIVTAGASELVFAPASTLVKMRDYVNEGGDSVFGAFVVGSVSVITDELMGKGMEIGAKYAGMGLAKAFNKVKGLMGNAEKAAATTAKRAATKGFAASSTAARVKSAAGKASSIRSQAQKKANAAIVKARMKGAANGKGSLFEEACAKRARKDGEKLVENFRKLCNDPLTPAEELRKAALAVQGNKSAQNVLRGHKSDLLRANFNAQIKEISKDVDVVWLEKTADKMKGVSKDKLKIVSMSGNDADLLRKGGKIAADRDVTMRLVTANGEVDLAEGLMRECYSEAFWEVNFKYLPADQQTMIKALTKYDQAVVNGLKSADSYGDDVVRIVNKARQTEKLADPKRVADTFVHKCKEFMDQGEAIKKQAMDLWDKGLQDEAMHVFGYGEALVEEGIRQEVKQFERILAPRIEVAVFKGQGGKYTQLYEKIKVLSGLGVPPPKGSLPLTLAEARATLQDAFGSTLEQVVKECGDAVLSVNQYL